MIVSHLIEAVLISVLGFLLWSENKRRDRIQSQEEGGLEGRDLDATAFSDMTDRENMKYVNHRAISPIFMILANASLPAAFGTSIKRCLVRFGQGDICSS
jgi:hypothetical protein